MILILTILLYGAACFYVGYNGWAWLKTTRLSKYKKAYLGLILVLTALFPLGFFSPLPVVYFVGMLWIIVVGYGLILLPLMNLAVYLLKGKGVFWFGIGFFVFLLFIVGYGSFNAWNPVIRNYHISIDKPSVHKELKLFVVSDLHLGTLVGENHLERMIDLIEKTKPDMVLIAGDLINDHIEPYKQNNLGHTMKKIKAPLGVYAIPGNHDYYGEDLDEMVTEMKKAGIKVLMDETVTVNDLYIVGRKDLTDEKRKKISNLVSNIDHSKPVIMMDHTPVELNEAKNNGIDLLLSGHTHRGQLAPANFITNWLFENDWGYLRKGDMQSLVSSGFGTWGPPLRIGSRAEAMLVQVQFK